MRNVGKMKMRASLVNLERNAAYEPVENTAPATTDGRLGRARRNSITAPDKRPQGHGGLLTSLLDENATLRRFLPREVLVSAEFLSF